MGRITRCNFKEGKSNRKQNSEMERVTEYINPEQSEVLYMTRPRDGECYSIQNSRMEKDTGYTYYMTSG
jgi:hypothetical protein